MLFRSLDCFNLIVPCGIVDRGVTSLERLVSHRIDLADVEQRIVAHFATVFDRVLALSGSAAGAER